MESSIKPKLVIYDNFSSGREIPAGNPQDTITNSPLENEEEMGEQDQFKDKMTDCQRGYFNKLCEVVHTKGGRVLSPYVAAGTKLWIKCGNKDHAAWEVRPCNIKQKQGSWCPTCAGRGKFTKDEVYKRARIIIEGEGGKIIELVGEFNGSKTRIKFHCGKGHEPEMRYDGLQQGKWCFECHFDKMRFTKEEIYERAKSIIESKGGEIREFIGEFNGARTRVKFHCGNGHEPEIVYCNIQRGRWCRECYFDSMKLTIEDARFLAEQKRGKCLSEEYINNHSPLDWVAPCGHIIKDRSYREVQQIGFSCKKCRKTEGEQQCALVLKELGIEFDSGQIPEIKGRYFDFIFEYKSSKFLLEFDGEQHFRISNLFHDTEEDFQKDRETDCHKTWTPILHGYKVIRINYKLKHINNIKYHITEALELNQSYYFSTPFLYEWILDAKERYLPGYTPWISGNCPIRRLSIVPDLIPGISSTNGTAYERPAHGQVPERSIQRLTIVSPSINNPPIATPPSIVIINCITINIVQTSATIPPFSNGSLVNH